jgi:type IV pilus assembly protein PilY1
MQNDISFRATTISGSDGSLTMLKSIYRPSSRIASLATTMLLVALSGMRVDAAEIALTDSPLFLNSAVPPMNMIVAGRDHKLFYEAYNDASDLDGDRVLDTNYKPAATFAYYGYFDSYKCYTHTAGVFEPASETANKQCTGSAEWSGDWLNYVTTARIDALRKVLYGGKRSSDTAAETILERTHIPMDAHSWGKEYTSTAVNGYDISLYTPYTQPGTNQYHLFANTTPNTSAADWTTDNGAPLLRVVQNSTHRIWEWVSKESPVAINHGDYSPTDFEVRVKACVTGLLGTERCQRYPSGNYKPIGLLQEFGENSSMDFGLLTGSYTANKSGGVLRKKAGTIRDEINLETDGTLTTTVGIIRTMDAFRVAGYNRYTSNEGGGGTGYDCGLPAMAKGPPADGSCRVWGNPVAEMMYESLRYFAGKAAPTPAFVTTKGTSFTDIETRLNLPRLDGSAGNTWDNPYQNRPVCAKAFQTVMTDVNPSYDSDQLPGAYFGLATGSDAIADTLTGLNVSTLATTITTHETGIVGSHFIGQSGADYDGAPTAKDVTDLGQIRGVAPEEPTKEGSYYAASVAYHGLTQDLNPAAAGVQNVQTFAVALASPLPKFEIPVGGRTITLVPFAKSVAYNSDIDRDKGKFQPTNQIVDFYVESLAADQSSGTFRVNFEDVEAGNDHDMDAIVKYSYRVVGSTLTVDVSSEYQAGGIIHHMGYVISGTDGDDGVYLVVQDCNRNAADGTYACNGSDPDYFLDTPDGEGPGGTWADGVGLPGFSRRNFTAGSTANATLLKDPLWYAAKWGGFQEPRTGGNNIPDVRSEWDNDPAAGDGTPDNYFLVTNALTLSQQLRNAFAEILTRTASASSAAVNSGSIRADSRAYLAKFDSSTWAGELHAYRVNTDGSLQQTREWDAAAKLPAANDRVIITRNSTGAAVPFRWSDLDTARKGLIDSDATKGPDRVGFLRGDEANEIRNGGLYRNRTSRLGDIVNSAPTYVGRPNFLYKDAMEAKPYSAFRAAQLSRTAMVYVGANDGMLHGFDAVTGVEKVAYIPAAVFSRLTTLADPSYAHRFYVDGSPAFADAYVNNNWHTMLVGGLNKGGQAIYALDVTDPSAFSDANATSIAAWEFGDADTAASGAPNGDPDLGYTFSRPTITKLNNGRWGAIFGNGYNNSTNDGVDSTSTTGFASLFIVDLETGRLIRKISTETGTAATPNGLATPAVIDINNDAKADFVYAGDLLGNLWKFDLRDVSEAQWKISYGTTVAPEPLFVAMDDANNPQPITTQPRVNYGPNGVGRLVLFGTGKFLEAQDKNRNPQRVQSFYGLYDNDTGTAADKLTRGQLLEQDIDREFSRVFGSVRQTVRTTTDKPLTTQRGWFMDLASPTLSYEGEKQVTDAVLRSGRIVFVTSIPDADSCSAGGKSYLMDLKAMTGGRVETSPFDLNDDGVFDNADGVPSSSAPNAPIQAVSGVSLAVANGQTPGIIAGSISDFIFIAGLTNRDQGTPQNPLADDDGDGLANNVDTDDDNDGIVDSNDPNNNTDDGGGGSPDKCVDSMSCMKRNPGPQDRGRQSWRQIR